MVYARQCLRSHLVASSPRYRLVTSALHKVTLGCHPKVIGVLHATPSLSVRPWSRTAESRSATVNARRSPTASGALLAAIRCQAAETIVFGTPPRDGRPLCGA